jgi:hypothetical protein
MIIIKDVIIAVVSSLITTLLGWLFISYVKPLIEAWRTRPESISGSWNVLLPTTETSEGILVIKQFGTRISAHLHLRRQGKDFDYSGVFLSQQLLLTFRDREHGSWMIGTFILRLRTDGTMLGRTLYWHHDHNEFQCNEYLVKRTKQI